MVERCRLWNQTHLGWSPARVTHARESCDSLCRVARRAWALGSETPRETASPAYCLSDWGRLLTLAEPGFSH